MFGRLHLKQKNEVSLIIMRNIREELAEVPLAFIKSVQYDMTTYPTLTIEIPQYIQRQNETIEYQLYSQIKGKMVAILEINGKKSKFIIDDDIQEKRTATHRVKTITAYGYEKTLEKKTFLISEGATRQLYRPVGEEVEISDGILNWFVQYNPYWKIGYVDELARKEQLWMNETKEISIAKNYTKNKVSVNGAIWTKSVSIDANKPFSITYHNLSSYLNDKLQKSENITHSFTLKKSVSKILATYTTSSDYLYGVDYTFTYTDGKTEVKRVGFTNVKDMKIVLEHLYLTVQTGELVEQLTTRYRFFEQCSTTWYSFLTCEVAEAFDCVFEFDSYNQTLNCYHKDNYGNDSGLYMSYENGIKEINKTYKVGETVSRLYVESANVSISEANKLGTEYVECFDYYIREGLMSDSLIFALKRYDTLLEEKQIEWLEIRQKKNKVDQQLTLKESELTSLNARYKYETSILSAYIQAGNDADKQAEQSQLVEQLDKEIQALMTTIQTLKDEADGYYQQMIKLGEGISKSLATDQQGKIFSDLDLQELEEFTVEGSIQNDTYLTSTGLYNYAIDYIKELNDVAIDFTISTENLIHRVVHPDGWQEVIALGERIWIDETDLLADDKPYIQLTAFTFNPNEKGGEITSLSFTNNKQPASDIQTIGDIGRQSAQTSNMTNFYKEVWKQAKSNNVHVAKLLEEGLDAAAMAVRGRSSINKIDITESGIFVIDATDENNQICLMSSMIAITQDRWKTSKLAITAQGVSTEVLIGQLILGEQLFIGNEDGTFVINPNGLSVFDKGNTEPGEERIFLGLETVNGVSKARLRLHSSKDDKKLVLSEDGIFQVIPVHAMDNFDKNHPLECAFYLSDNIQTIHDFSVRVKLDKFRGYTKSASSTPSSTIVSSTLGGGSTTYSTTSEASDIINIELESEIKRWNGHISTSEPFMYVDSHEKHLHKVELGGWLDHSHTMQGTINPHTHKVAIKMADHTHKFELTNEGHTHQLEYGIYEFSQSPTVNVYLDNKVIQSNVSSVIEPIDLASYVEGLTPGWHVIKIVGVAKANNPLGLGRASIDASIGAFVTF